MDQYCVVLCGLQAEASDEPATWQPVAAALKLDHAEFERRVLAVLPRIVRRGVDQVKAEHIARALRAMHVDARVLPDDPQLVYIERAGARCGPLPQSSLDDFIQPGESFRLRGSTAWQPWPTPADQESTATAATTVEPEDSDDLPSPPAFSDEPIDARSTAVTTNDDGDAASDEQSTGTEDEPPEAALNPPPSDAWDDRSDATQDVLPTGADDEPHDAMPPSLGAALTAQEEESTFAPPEALEATEPTADSVESARDDDLINASGETTTPDSADASSAATPEAAETETPTRFRIGRLVVLLILVALAVWAYRHWMADTRVDGSQAVPAVIQPSSPAAGEPAMPARTVPGDNAAPAAAATTQSPATATSAPTPAGTSASLLVPAAVPAAATSTTTAATIPTESSGTLPANVDTVVLAQPVRTALAPAMQPAETAH